MWGHGSTHLHTASGYSARYGAALPDVLVQRAAERGMTSLALTDRDTVAGTVRFAKAAVAAGVHGFLDSPTVHQGGPRRLWDALERIRHRLNHEGGPPLHGARVTITPDGKTTLSRGSWSLTL